MTVLSLNARFRCPWSLSLNASCSQVRADEASHRDVNHTFSSLRLDQTNPLVHAHAHTLMKPAEMHTPADHATIARHKEFEDEQAAEKLAKQAA